MNYRVSGKNVHEIVCFDTCHLQLEQLKVPIFLSFCFSHSILRDLEFHGLKIFVRGQYGVSAAQSVHTSSLIIVHT